MAMPCKRTGHGAGVRPAVKIPPMDDIVLRGMARWPNVPSVYGWLALDRRGHWLLKGERVGNPGIVDFFGRNYARDERGRWFLQNGPQRVFVTLHCTPYVYRVTSPADGALQFAAHTGAVVREIRAALVDDAGQLLLDTDLGAGIVHDADLGLLLPRFRDSAGQRPGDAALDDALLQLQDGRDGGLLFDTGTGAVPVRPVRAAEVPERFGFVPRPVQPAGEEECY